MSSKQDSWDACNERYLPEEEIIRLHEQVKELCEVKYKCDTSRLKVTQLLNFMCTLRFYLCTDLSQNVNKEFKQTLTTWTIMLCGLMREPCQVLQSITGQTLYTALHWTTIPY